MNFMIVMDPNAPAPRAGGDYKSWFLYYKWGEDNGEAFMPVSKEGSPEVADAKAGDTLWFLMGGEWLGYVEIIRVEEDPMNAGTFEVWYDCSKVTKVENTRANFTCAPGFYNLDHDPLATIK